MAGGQFGEGRDERVSTGDKVTITTRDGSRVTGTVAYLTGSGHQNIAIRDAAGYTYNGRTATATKK